MTDRREERRRSRVAYARRHAKVLLVVFGAFVLFGLWRDNFAAIAGGAVGTAWVLWALRSPE
ncbi:MAG: hypothetical protein AAFU49_12855 [Pseudomonadota bacterium]